MKYLYLFPHHFLMIIVLLFSLSIILHVTLIIHEFLHRNFKKILFDLCLFLYLFELIFIITDIAEHSHSRVIWMLPHYQTALYIFWLLVTAGTVKALYNGYKKHIIMIPAVLIFTLPVAEQLSKGFYPYLLLGASIVLFMCSGYSLIGNIEKYSHSLSSMSIKEAIDSMDLGLLFCETKPGHDGQILLENIAIQELMDTLTGKFYYNGKNFYQDLERGAVLPSCQKRQIEDSIAYELPDQTIWSFDLLPLEGDTQNRVLLVASDITEIWNALSKIYEQNQELVQKNRELQELMDNLENICRTETLLQYKVKVHNILGQRLSVMMRALREQKEPSKEFLISLLNNIEEELKNPSIDLLYSLDSLKKSFQGIDVTIKIEGNLPQDPMIAKSFYEIIMEACTNAVRHGYASEISIKITEDKLVSLDIENNGHPPDQKILEGGGLSEMRRKVHLLNGNFSYTTSPWFHIHIEV